ncbi:hypothetical protein C8F01DRAFT_1256726 [Mycena amicta]|nr:hypothetical protein C8F01DRAFT_1256726 [Mycena amicta]
MASGKQKAKAKPSASKGTGKPKTPTIVDWKLRAERAEKALKAIENQKRKPKLIP